MQSKYSIIALGKDTVPQHMQQSGSALLVTKSPTHTIHLYLKYQTS